MKMENTVMCCCCKEYFSSFIDLEWSKMEKLNVIIFPFKCSSCFVGQDGLFIVFYAISFCLSFCQNITETSSGGQIGLYFVSALHSLCCI